MGFLSSLLCCHTSSNVQSFPASDAQDEKQSVLANSKPLTTSKAAPAPAPAKPKTVKPEPYSQVAALALFKQYADPDDADVIGPVGLEKLCSEGDIPLEGALPIILAWLLGAKEMGKFTKQEWTTGTSNLKISSLPALSAALKEFEDLLIHGKQVKDSSTPGKNDPYDRTHYRMYAADRKESFQKLYSFCFTFAKPEQSRNIDMETSAAFWAVLLEPQYRIVKEILEFIEEKGTYRATNKDLWTMMLEFCSTVDPDLRDYESDGAWPTLIDDFVEWKQAKSGAPNGDAADEE